MKLDKVKKVWEKIRGLFPDLTLRKKYAYAWILWVVAFGVIEWRAIVDDDKAEGDFTLSHFTRRLLGKDVDAKLKHWAFRLGLGGFFVWIIPHFYSFLWE